MADDTASDQAVWDELVARLEDSLAPEWIRFARGSADTSWMRAMLLVDAHDRLSSATTTEHVSHTLHHLAAANGNEAEATGWQALHEKRREERRMLLLRIEEVGPMVLTGDPAALFARSINPIQVI
ncbi:MAG: hypothetical protein EXQ74_07520 [Thermoleophilia bacterium]|nr:hypothetical protein [Thermoleophilia bacterium]